MATQPPSHHTLGRVKKDLDRVVPPGTWMTTIKVFIPNAVEPGAYTVKGRVGDFGETILDSEVFDLVIPGTVE